MIIPAAIAIPIAPLYLFTNDSLWITVGFGLQGRVWRRALQPAPELPRGAVPTEVRATASAFCYHQGAIFGGFVALVLAFFAVNFNLGYAIPMLVGTVVGSRQCRRLAAAQPGDQGQGSRRRTLGGLTSLTGAGPLPRPYAARLSCQPTSSETGIMQAAALSGQVQPSA